MGAAYKRQKRKEKKRKKKEDMDALKATLHEPVVQHIFSNLDKDQRIQLHLYAQQMGAVPKFRGQGNEYLNPNDY